MFLLSISNKQKMKIEHHINKIKRFEGTIGRLDYEKDYETLIEDYMLVSAHLINAAMHKLKKLKESKDIKHNLLSSFLKKQQALDDKSDEISSLMLSLENLRPSHVYGRGENGEIAKRAEEFYKKIKTICGGIIFSNLNETEDKNNKSGEEVESESKNSD